MAERPGCCYSLHMGGILHSTYIASNACDETWLVLCTPTPTTTTTTTATMRQRASGELFAGPVRNVPKLNRCRGMELESLAAVSGLLRLKTAKTFEAAIFGYCAFIAVGQYAKTRDLPWMQALVYSTCASFGGGIIVPILINETPFPMAHDLAIPSVAACLFLTKSSGRWRGFVQGRVGKVLFGTLFEMMRTTIILNWLRAGQRNIATESYFSSKHPNFFGPVTCGTIAGCGGAFCFSGAGLDTLSAPAEVAGTFWPAFSALLVSVFYHTGKPAARKLAELDLRMEAVGYTCGDNPLLDMGELSGFVIKQAVTCNDHAEAAYYKNPRFPRSCCYCDEEDPSQLLDLQRDAVWLKLGGRKCLDICAYCYGKPECKLQLHGAVNSHHLNMQTAGKFPKEKASGNSNDSDDGDGGGDEASGVAGYLLTYNNRAG